MKNTFLPLALAVIVLFSGCKPKMTYRVAVGTQLILPFSGGAETTEIDGKVVSGKFEGNYGKIRVSSGSLYFKNGDKWDEYPEINRYYEIKLTGTGELLFDGKVIAPSKQVSENEI
jgi:hypothetical protein